MKKVYVYVLLTAFLFGSMEVALKLAGGNVDSFELTFLRFAVAGILLLPIAINDIRKNNIHLSIKDMAFIVLLGVICVPLSMLAFQIGVMKSNASTAAVLLSSNPIFTMIFAHFLSDEQFTRKKLLVLVTGAAGMIFMIKPWDMQEGNTAEGVLCVLFAAVAFGLYAVLGKDMNTKIGILAQTSFSFIAGAAVLLIIMLVLGKPVVADVPDNIGIIVYASVFVTALGYFSFFMAIKNSDAATGSVAFFLKIVIAPILAIIILKESLTWNMCIGIVFLLAASYMNLKKNIWKRNTESLDKG